MSPLKEFIKINQLLSKRIENVLPHAKLDITETYSLLISEYVNKKDDQIIVDVGGGRFTPFAKYLGPQNKHKLIVIDNNGDELNKNIDANKIIIANVNKLLPLKSKSINLIVSRYVLEHLKDLPNFISNSRKILKKNGYSIHLFSCKFAPFALLNQLLPKRLARLLLNSLVSDSKYIRGFKTNYDYCYYNSIMKLFIKKGFVIEKVYISYYQSKYFSFFLPFYIISILYEIILYSLNLKNFCAYILIVAKKNGD